MSSIFQQSKIISFVSVNALTVDQLLQLRNSHVRCVTWLHYQKAVLVYFTFTIFCLFTIADLNVSPSLINTQYFVVYWALSVLLTADA